MTPDTTALRRDHYDYDSDRHCDECGERHPCTVRALCDGYDEAQMLAGFAERFADLVADLRALCDEADQPTRAGFDHSITRTVPTDRLRDLIDRHAPEAGR